MRSKKIELIVLTSFNSLEVINSQYLNFFLRIKKDVKVSFVNISNLGIFEKKKIKKFDNSSKFEFDQKNPISFTDFKKIIIEKKNNGKKLVFMDNIPRNYNYFYLFFLIKKMNIPNIVIANLGNIQPPSYYYKINFFNFLNIFLLRKVPRIIYFFFTIINIFPKVDILFLSNRKMFKILKKKESYFFSRIKKVIFLNSIQDTENKKSTKKFILLIEKDIRYLVKYKKYKLKIDDFEYREHFKNNYHLLKRLSKYYKKKPIVSIHPNYDYRFIKQQFKDIKVVKKDTKKIIEDSFLILFFDSSVIIHAIKKGKKIINVRSNLFEKIKFKTDIYNQYLKILSISNSKKDINMRKLDNYLKKRNSYGKFLKTYISPANNKQITKKFLRSIKSI